MGRGSMIVAITGTPGAGKTSVASKLAEMTGWRLVRLNELAEKKGLYSGKDEKRGCRIVNPEAIRKEVSEMAGTGGRNLIVESHYAQDMDADLVVVLRANPGEIRKRGAEKGWDFNKTEENVVAEIMEECKLDSMEQGRTTREIDTTGRKPEEAAKDVASAMQAEGMFLDEDVGIPESMRDELRQPYGKLYAGLGEAVSAIGDGMLISVGDFVTQSLYDSGLMPHIFVVDGKVRRKPFERKVPLDYDAFRARNGAGCITRELWMAVEGALGKDDPSRIEVDGEEDMAVLPFMLMAPEGSHVVYGLFDKGVCVVRVDDDASRTARNLLKRIAAPGKPCDKLKR